MKFQNVLFLCSMFFAAGMIVPFAFVEFHASSNHSQPVETVSLGAPAPQQVLAKPALPGLNREDFGAPQPGDLQALKGAPKGKLVVTEIGRADPASFGDPVSSRQKPAERTAADDAPAAAQVALDVGQELIADVQTELLVLGYDPGIIDGKFGARTENAIKALQADRGLAVTGVIDSALLEALNIDQAEEPQSPAAESEIDASQPIIEAEAEQIAPVQTSQNPSTPTNLFDQQR